MIDVPKCWERKCKYFIGVISEIEGRERPICRAFPNGIPEEIAYGNNLHTDPYPGDHGIRYEPEDE